MELVIHPSEICLKNTYLNQQKLWLKALFFMKLSSFINYLILNTSRAELFGGGGDVNIFSMSTISWHWNVAWNRNRYNDVIMNTMASQITSLTIVYSSVNPATDKKYQSSASLDFVRGIHRGPVYSPHKRPVTRKMSPFHDVIMSFSTLRWHG